MKRDTPLPPTQCAAEGCRCTITRGWFCYEHWTAIPPKMRAAVLAAFNASRKAYCRAPRDEQERLNKAYATAFEACQNHLRRITRSMNPVAYDARDYADKLINGGAPTKFRYVNGRML